MLQLQRPARVIIVINKFDINNYTDYKADIDKQISDAFMEGEGEKAKCTEVTENTLKQRHKRIQKIAEVSVVLVCSLH